MADAGSSVWPAGDAWHIRSAIPYGGMCSFFVAMAENPPPGSAPRPMRPFRGQVTTLPATAFRAAGYHHALSTERLFRINEEHEPTRGVT